MMMVSDIFGETGPIFGGARLPNGLGMINRGNDLVRPNGALDDNHQNFRNVF